MLGPRFPSGTHEGSVGTVARSGEEERSNNNNNNSNYGGGGGGGGGGGAVKIEWVRKTKKKRGALFNE